MKKYIFESSNAQYKPFNVWIWIAKEINKYSNLLQQLALQYPPYVPTVPTYHDN